MPDSSFSIDTLESLAGQKVFQRGLAYFETGAVRSLQAGVTRASAQVDGSTRYSTELFIEDGELACRCDCPHAADGWFCKHAVATGLAWLAARERGEITVEGNLAASESGSLVQRWLEKQSQPGLVRLLLDFANADDALMRRLYLRAEMDEGPDTNALRNAIEEATLIDHYDWHGTASLARDIENLVRLLKGLLATEKVAALLELCEYAIARIEALLEQIDDSDGEFSWSLEALQSLHYEACQRVQPEPLELARRLFEAELGARFDAFYESAIVYRELLREEGLRHFQELALRHWQTAGAKADRWTITRMMEYLARQSGDLEALVAIKRQNLSSAYRYLAIAELYQEAGLHEDALHWAEQGLAAFGAGDSRLVDFLTKRYQACGRSDAALALAWNHFEARPGLESYQKLKLHADTLERWPQQRERTLSWLGSSGNQSLRLSIALWEQDLAGAWDAAQKGPCQQPLLLELAKALESEQPLNAVSLYRPIVEQYVERTNNNAYDEAVRLIQRINALMPSDQSAQLRRLWRQRYKAKRNFITRLDALERLLGH